MNLLLLFMFLVQSLLRGPIGALLHPALLHLLIPALLHTATSYGKGGGERWHDVEERCNHYPCLEGLLSSQMRTAPTNRRGRIYSDDNAERKAINKQ